MLLNIVLLIFMKIRMASILFQKLIFRDKKQMSDDIESLKQSILNQNQILDNIETELNFKELELLKKENEFNDLQRRIIEKFDGKNTISEVVSYINSQYEELDKQISELEKNSDNQSNESLEKLAKDIQMLVKNNSVDGYIKEQIKSIELCEDKLSMLPKTE